MARLRKYRVRWAELIQHEEEVEAINVEEAIKMVKASNETEGAGDWDWEEIDDD